MTAGAAWTPPEGALNKVLVFLTPLAPGLEGREISDNARWRWMDWVTPAQATRRVLMRLNRRADQVCLRVAEGHDGVEIHEGQPPLSGCERLLAIIFDVPPTAVRRAWAALQPAAEIERHALEGATVLAFKRKEAA